MPSCAANSAALAPSRLATAISSPFLEAWMAGSTAARPILAVLMTPQRILRSGIALPLVNTCHMLRAAPSRFALLGSASWVVTASESQGEAGRARVGAAAQLAGGRVAPANLE